MRIAITAVALAMLVGTAMAQTTTGSSSIGGPVQSYWAAYNSSFTQIAPPGGADDVTHIDVTAKVPYMAAETLAGSSIDFDLLSVAAGSKLMSLGLQNDANCNFPFYIYLAPEGCPNIENLSWDAANGYTTDGLGSQVMAIQWFFSVDGGATKVAATVGTPVAGAVKGPTFGSGPRSFLWFVELAPNANQRPGIYSLDPAVCIAPDL